MLWDYYFRNYSRIIELESLFSNLYSMIIVLELFFQNVLSKYCSRIFILDCFSPSWSCKLPSRSISDIPIFGVKFQRQCCIIHLLAVSSSNVNSWFSLFISTSSKWIHCSRQPSKQEISEQQDYSKVQRIPFIYTLLSCSLLD